MPLIFHALSASSSASSLQSVPEESSLSSQSSVSPSIAPQGDSSPAHIPVPINSNSNTHSILSSTGGTSSVNTQHPHQLHSRGHLDDTSSVGSSSVFTFLPRPTRPASITLPYKSSPNPFHTLDLYLPASGLSPSTPWFFFLHGGYWQDASQSKDVGAAVLSRLPPHWAGASIDYRLSPEISHPGHLEDVKRAFKFLQSAYEVSHAVIMAHGAGACIAYQYIFSELTMDHGGWIRHVITSGGVYDLPELAKDSPYYHKFIADAYGDNPEHWYELSPQNFEWESVSPADRPATATIGGAHLDEAPDTNMERAFFGNIEEAAPSRRSHESPLAAAIASAYTAPRPPLRQGLGAAAAGAPSQQPMDVTLVHSKFDLIVPIQQSLRFDDKLTNAGFRCSLRLLSIDGHDTVLETTELALIALEVCKHMDEEEEQRYDQSFC